MYKPIKTISIAKDGGKYMLILGDRTGAGVSAGIYDTQKDAIDMLTYCMDLFGVDEVATKINEEEVRYKLISEHKVTGYRNIIGEYKTERDVVVAARKVDLGTFQYLVLQRNTITTTKQNGEIIDRKIKERAEWVI